MILHSLTLADKYCLEHSLEIEIIPNQQEVVRRAVHYIHGTRSVA